ncbi:MAG TPA: ABC transporter ATP-binding protein [Sporosarcina sp.]|nr:ABC transporter ATP-binding protein [Sporosarcina sp.]
MTMLELKQISLAYGDHQVLDRINLSARKGEIIGLVAPNGTGKTTLFHVMANFLKPDAGTVIIDGKHQYKTEKDELNIHKQLISFPEQHHLFEELSGKDHIKLYANLWKGTTKHVQKVIDDLNMNHYVRRKVSTYSMGMRQRLCFAMLVAADTPIMIMDEIMNGLDVENVSLLSNHLIEMKKAGKLIFIASHLLENLDVYADRVLYLKDGHFIHEQHLHEGAQDDYVKVSLSEKQYEELQARFPLPEAHQFIAKHLLCIPLRGMDMKEQTNWITTILEKGYSNVSIGPLGTVDIYEKYYHEKQ